MKKLVNVSVLFVIIALVFLLAAGSASAAPPQQVGRPGGGEREPVRPGGWGAGGASAQGSTAAEPSGTSVRINFELGGHKAHHGLYVVRDLKGNVLATWYAQEGWRDSGWLSGFELDKKAVWVVVLYYPNPNARPTTMKILKPAPGTTYGWVSQGMAHAIEVAWPDMSAMPADTMPVMMGGSPQAAEAMTAASQGGMPVRPSGPPAGPSGPPAGPSGPPVRLGG